MQRRLARGFEPSQLSCKGCISGAKSFLMLPAGFSQDSGQQGNPSARLQGKTVTLRPQQLQGPLTHCGCSACADIWQTDLPLKSWQNWVNFPAQEHGCPWEKGENGGPTSPSLKVSVRASATDGELCRLTAPGSSEKTPLGA